jgi:predicted Zn-dependent protease
MMCADKTRHDGYLMETASNYWRLRPKDAAAINNYAYTLLVFRQQPEDAITLTLGLVRDHPRDVDMQLNHAAALALNDRVQEADDILKRVNPNELKPALAAQYYLTRLEVYWKTKRPDLARSTAARIDPGQLYPVQATWLTNALQQLDTAQPAPAGKGTSPGP